VLKLFTVHLLLGHYIIITTGTSCIPSASNLVFIYSSFLSLLSKRAGQKAEQSQEPVEDIFHKNEQTGGFFFSFLSEPKEQVLCNSAFPVFRVLTTTVKAGKIKCMKTTVRVNR